MSVGVNAASGEGISGPWRPNLRRSSSRAPSSRRTLSSSATCNPVSRSTQCLDGRPRLAALQTSLSAQGVSNPEEIQEESSPLTVLHVALKSTDRAARGAKGELRQAVGCSRAPLIDCFAIDYRQWDRSPKVHAAVDALGRPLRIDVTGGQTLDGKAFRAFQNWRHASLAIVADKACASSAIRQAIADEGAVAVIPSKSSAPRPIPTLCAISSNAPSAG